MVNTWSLYVCTYMYLRSVHNMSNIKHSLSSSKCTHTSFKTGVRMCHRALLSGNWKFKTHLSSEFSSAQNSTLTSITSNSQLFSLKFLGEIQAIELSSFESTFKIQNTTTFFDGFGIYLCVLIVNCIVKCTRINNV